MFFNFYKSYFLLFGLLTCGLWITLSNAQTYGNATYNRLRIVKQYHTREFDVDTGHVVNEYMEEIAVIPYLGGVALFLAIVIFQIALCARWCCNCCRCIDEVDNSSLARFTKWADNVKNSRIRLKGCFFFFVTATIVFCSGFMIVRAYFAKASDILLDATDYLYDLTIDLEDSGDDLIYLGDSVFNTTLLAVPTCPESTLILNYTDTYLNYVNDYNDIIDPIPGNIDDLKQFAEVGADQVDGSLWSLTTIYFVVCCVNIVAYCLRKRVMMRFSLGTEFVLIYFSVFAWVISLVMLVRLQCRWIEFHHLSCVIFAHAIADGALRFLHGPN